MVKLTFTDMRCQGLTFTDMRGETRKKPQHFIGNRQGLTSVKEINALITYFLVKKNQEETCNRLMRFIFSSANFLSSAFFSLASFTSNCRRSFSKLQFLDNEIPTPSYTSQNLPLRLQEADLFSRLINFINLYTPDSFQDDVNKTK